MKVDIAIVGGALVGASLAAALAESPWRLALVDSAPREVQGLDEGHDWDSRIYAISSASQALLARIGVWQRMNPQRLTPVRTMRIFGDRGGGLTFSAYEAGVGELAWIVESGAMMRALSAVLQRQPNLALLQPATPQSLTVDAASARIMLDGDDCIECSLVVGADGAQSFVREAAGLTAQVVPYAQHGVVANFACEKDHHGTAFQWFRGDGVLAWLPLPGRRMSMVWSTPVEHANQLKALDPAGLCACVAQAGGHALGELQLITPPQSYPLSRVSLKHVVGNRVALIGDAAHVVHPLAGQGVNLGFGDAAELARVLMSEGLAAGRAGHRAGYGADPGERRWLRRYERVRAEDVLAMRVATDALVRLFGQSNGLVVSLRNGGMNLADGLPIIKNLLVGHALGTRVVSMR